MLILFLIKVHLFAHITLFRGWEMLLQGTRSAPMCNSLHSPLQLSHKASEVTLSLPFWLLLFFVPSPGGYFSLSCPSLMPGKPSSPLQAAAGMNSASSSVLHNHVNWQFLHFLCRGWNRLCKAWTRGESGSVNFSPLCKPSLILTIPQPFPCTHQQARTKPGITMCCQHSQPTNCQLSSLPLFFFF